MKYLVILILFLVFAELLFSQNEIKQLQDSLQIVQENKQIDIYLKLMNEYISQQKFDETEEIIKKVENSKIKTATSVQKAKFLLQVGILKYEQGIYNEAIDVLYKAEKVKASEFKYFYKLYLYLGNAYWIKNDFFTSLKYYIKTEKIMDSLKINKGSIITNIGLVYLSVNRFQDALIYFFEALKLYSKGQYKSCESLLYNNIAEVYFLQKEYSEAEIYYLKAYDLCKNKKGVTRLLILSNLANYYLRTNDLDRSKFYLEKAIKFSAEEKKIYIETYILSLEGEFLNKTGQYIEAISKFNKAIEFGEKMGVANFSNSSYKGLSESYYMLKKYKKAYQYYQKYVNIHDSLYSKKMFNQINMLEVSYNSGRKDLEIAKKNEQILSEQYIKYIILASILIVILISILYIIKYTTQNRIMITQTEELKKANGTKNKIVKIISHDLKSPLLAMVGVTNVLKSEVWQMKKNEIKEYVAILNSSVFKTMSFLDNLLNWAKSHTDDIKLEIKEILINDVIEDATKLLKQSAKNKKIEIINEVSENLKVLGDRATLMTVFRNLLSNAIKFTHKKSKITLSYQKSGTHIIISIVDTGVGIEADIAKKLFKVENIISTKGTANEVGTGLGLILCKEFVEKNNGKIWVESEIGKGTTFKVSLRSV